jgi:hypothetical protein
MDAYMSTLDSGCEDRACFLQVIATNQCLGRMTTRTEGSNRNQHFYLLYQLLFSLCDFPSRQCFAIWLAHVQFNFLACARHGTASFPPFQHQSQARVVSKHYSHVSIFGPNRIGNRPDDCIVAFVNTCYPRGGLHNIPLHSPHQGKHQNPLSVHLARL